MTVSVSIQTHPKRADMAERLRRLVPGSELVVDPDPAGFPSPWRTYRTALERHIAGPSPSSHLLILQDDVMVCANLVAAAEQVAKAKPGNLVALFVAHMPRESRDAVWAACDADEVYALLPRPMPGESKTYWVPVVALMWPTSLIAPALEFVDGQGWPVQFRADDEIVGRAARHHNWDVYATVPCLVEHPDDVPSVVGVRRAMGGANLDRVSCCFIGDGDPLEVAW